MAERIKYPLAYNPVLEYWEKIQNKEIKVCDKIYRTYQKVVNDINNPGEYFYSPNRANHILEFAENYCRHSKGKFGGKPVRLELWEKAHLATIFGFIDINDFNPRPHKGSDCKHIQKNNQFSYTFTTLYH